MSTDYRSLVRQYAQFLGVEPAAAVQPPESNGKPATGRPAVLCSLAQLLANPDALKPPEPIAPKLAWRGFVTLLAGREKLSGKSTLLTAAASAVTHGGMFLGEPCQGGVVLWVSSDREAAAIIAQRAHRFGAAPDQLHILWPGTAPFADLASTVELLHPCWTIIDTLPNFAAVSDPHSSAEWPGVLLPFTSLARDGQCAVTLAHHACKAENGGYRDSSAIGANVDVLIELQPDPDQPQTRRAKSVGRWAAEEWTCQLRGSEYHLVSSDAEPEDRELTAQDRTALRALRDLGNATSDEWRKTAGIPDRSFYRVRARLTRFLAVVQERRKYRLTELGLAAIAGPLDATVS